MVNTYLALILHNRRSFKEIPEEFKNRVMNELRNLIKQGKLSQEKYDSLVESD